MDKEEDRCSWCSEEIKVQIFKGTGHCSEEHRKLIEGWKKHMNDLYKQKTDTKE